MVDLEASGKDGYMSVAMAAIQRATIEKLRADNSKLKEELLLENKFSVTPVDNIAAHRIVSMQDEADGLTRKVQLEQRKVALAELETQNLNSKLSSYQEMIKESGGINSAQSKSIELQKETKRLESRREQVSIKYNEAITHNKKLRAQIESLRRERLVFDGIHKNLEKEMQGKKEEMAEIISHTNAAFEAREKAIAEMAALKASADKEQAQFEEEWKRLGAIIEDDRRMRELQRLREMEERERKTQELLKSKEAAFYGKKQAKQTEKQRSKYKSDEVESMDKVQMFGEAFQKIQSATGIQDIDELVEKFKCADDQNYTLFTYVNELNQEIVKLDEQVKAIELEIREYQQENEARKQEQVSSREKMQERLQANENQAKLYMERYDNALKTVATLRSGVDALFKSMKCDTEAVRELLGGEITDQNVLRFLSVVEQRASEILRVHAASLQRSGAETEHLKLTMQMSQSTLAKPTTHVMIAPPSTNDEEYEDMEHYEGGDDDNDPKPLGREQLRAKVQRSLPRKGDTAIFRIADKQAVHGRKK